MFYVSKVPEANYIQEEEVDQPISNMTKDPGKFFLKRPDRLLI